ncbi:MAG: ion channel [Thermoplasmatales archaeon]|nr:ion channel [Candidatus Thermoplasmatota archaeon]MDA8054586.1 ion channel [Thermoplasmatales archaeon]
MKLRVRVGNSSTISYIIYIVTLLGTAIYLAISAGHEVHPNVLYGLANALLVTFVFSLVSLRGLIVRVRYAFFLAALTIFFTVASVSLLGGNFLINAIPLLIVSVASVALLIKNYRYYNFPTRLFDRPEITISIIIIVMVLLIGVIGTLLLGDQFKPKITDASRALYYTGEVVTTLGFGDILPITRTSQIFSIAMSIVGIGSFFGAVTVIVGPLIYERGRRVVRVIQKVEGRLMDDYVLFVDFNPLLVPLLNKLVLRDELLIVALDDKSKELLITEKMVFLEIDDNMEKIISTLDLRRSKRIVLGSGDDSRNIMNALYIVSNYPGDDVKKKMISLVNLSTNTARIQTLVGDVINPAGMIAENSSSLF